MHNRFFWHVARKELIQVYISMVLRDFAISLLSLFVPLYLYRELGYSLQQTLLFYIFYAVIFAICTPLAAKFCSKYGVKHAVLLSVPLYLGFVSLLYVLSLVKISLLLVALLLGAALAFYWIGMHLIFYHASHRAHRGEEIGKLTSLTRLSTMFGPLLGGIIITSVGFWMVFALAAVILLASAVVLFFSKDNHVTYRFTARALAERKQWKNSLFFVSRGASVIAESVIWPLFIFVILESYVSLGLVGFLVSGITALLVFLVGKYSDHASKRKIVRLITLPESAAWIVRAAVTTTSHVFGATIFAALTTGIREAPMAALEYDKAKENPASYFVTREIFINLGRILMLSFVLLADSLSSGFVLQGILNLTALLF